MTSNNASTLQLPVPRFWPELRSEPQYGIAGKYMQLIEPESEADPVGLLVDFIVKFGSVVGSGPHFRVEATRHPLNLFALLVGATADGRKGTIDGHGRAFFKRVGQLTRERRGAHGVVVSEESTARLNVQSGLSSAEGLISAVRDPVESDEKVIDEGVEDKRLCIVESEFSSVLKRMEREDNTLSAVLRDAWDGKDLQTLTKHCPQLATRPHISLIAHSTPDELRRYLRRTEQVNGFINRFLITCVRRSKELPSGGDVDFLDASLEPLIKDVTEIASEVFSIGDFEIRRTAAANELWHESYHDLTTGVPGLVGATIARGAPLVLRLACIFALLDWCLEIDVRHLEAALALWEYCEGSARYVFADTLGDPIADTILPALRRALDSGLTRTEISALFNRNKSEDEINAALEVLEKCRLARHEKRSGAGRPAEIWLAT